ncbi:hypothetical protein [Sphingomonas sp.]|uniref:hypothetical protein n=1 Tax=Sphingomonas sp. TaxID=28214 RepID=UPI0031DB25D3
MSRDIQGASAEADQALVSDQAAARLDPSGFDPSRKCDSCAFIGVIYWNGETHHCLKSDERRRDNFRSCGDFAEDFMSEFRKFYDARAGQKACRHYQERTPLKPETLELLRRVSDAGKDGFVAKFFSQENYALTHLRDKFVTSDFAFPREPARGERRYWLTKLGAAELSRDSDGNPQGGDGTAPSRSDDSAGPKDIAQPPAGDA